MNCLAKSLCRRGFSLALALALLLAASPLTALAADSVPLVIMTHTVNDLGYLSPGLMPPMTDDLGGTYYFSAEGRNADRTYFSVQNIPTSRDHKPSQITFPYDRDGQQGQISYTLNQQSLGKAYLYKIRVSGLPITRAMLSSPLRGDNRFICEQVPSTSGGELVLWLVGGEHPHLVLMEGDELAFNLELDGGDYPVNPNAESETTPIHMVTGEYTSMYITLMDVYTFSRNHSQLERDPEAPGIIPEVRLDQWELLVYPDADPTLYLDPDLAQESPVQLEGGNSYIASDVLDHEECLAILVEYKGAYQIVGFMPKGVEKIIYRKLN